jgi:hypothetical protein
MYTIITSKHQVINNLTWEQAIEICPEDALLLSVKEGKVTAIRTVKRYETNGMGSNYEAIHLSNVTT